MPVLLEWWKKLTETGLKNCAMTLMNECLNGLLPGFVKIVCSSVIDNHFAEAVTAERGWIWQRLVSFLSYSPNLSLKISLLQHCCEDFLRYIQEANRPSQQVLSFAETFSC